MRCNYYLYPLSLCLSFSLTTSLKASELFPLKTNNFEKIKAEFDFNIAGKSISQKPSRLKLIKEHRDKKGRYHSRWQQYYQDVPVFNGYVIFHSARSAKQIFQDHNPIEMNGALYDKLEEDLKVMPKNYKEKGSVFIKTFLEPYTDKNITETIIESMIYIDNDNKAHWAYQMSATVIHDDKIPEKPVVIMDAKTKVIYLEWDEIKTTWSKVNGLGYGGNKKIGLYQYGKDFPYLPLARDDEQGICYLENPDVKVVDLKGTKKNLTTAMAFSCKKNEDGLDYYWTGVKGNGYDLINGAYSPTNDAMYTGLVIKAMFKDWYKVEVLRTRKGPMQLVMRVHYGKEFSNAFWDGRFMTFGDGAYDLYPLVSLGITAHEVSHGFTEQNANLIYMRQSGGMNEAFSDMAAQAAEYYVTGSNHWEIGSEIFKRNRALRYMDHPARDGHSIESVADYDDHLNVHYSSGVYNRLFYLMATAPGWNTHKAFDVMVKANMDYWIPMETFENGACGILKAARDLDYDLKVIQDALAGVGIHDASCSYA